MKANPDKCHFICSTNDTVNLIIENQIIDNNKCEKLVGVKFDYKLISNAHNDGISKKQSWLLVNAFFMSQHNYCPFIWMCHDCTKNNKINIIHESCLHWKSNDQKSSFDNLLNKDKSVSIHHKNLRSLAFKMYKIHRGISPEILNDLFPLRQANQYNLRNRSRLITSNVKNAFESLRYLGPKIWSHLKRIDYLKNYYQKRTRIMSMLALQSIYSKHRTYVDLYVYIYNIYIYI